MTCAYWCVLAAIMLPYIWVTVAKAGGFDNAAPRDSLASLVGWRRRADWAHLNAFEAIPSFAAAVIIAHMLHGDQQTVDLLAMTFIGARVLHGICYVADLSTLRSLMWLIGMICIVSLFLTGT
ncbi:MAG: MAPEG family protein [Myxococcales bacterium]|nr:MAPEG family protein [Myxococcales bacterium]